MYQKLIEHFWSVRNSNPMTSYEADLYFYLVHECSIRDWANPFELRSKKIERDLDISRKTICSIRAKLEQKGLIQFEEGEKRGKGAMYNIVYVSQSNIKGNIKEEVYVTQGNIKGNINQPIPPSEYATEPILPKMSEEKKQVGKITKEKTKQKEKNPPLPPIKEKINKKEKPTLIARVQGELFDIPEPKNKKIVLPPPTIDEVKAYFKKKGVPNYEEEAETFFYHFDSLGWRNIHGVRIEHWDSKANYWISKEKKNGNKEDRRNTKAENVKQLIEDFASVASGQKMSAYQTEVPDL